MGSCVAIKKPVLEISNDGGELYVSLDAPAVFSVKAISALTGEIKIYILKVSKKGLCLV